MQAIFSGRTIFFGWLALLVLLPPCLTTARAEGVAFPDIDGPVEGHPDVTYLDLSRLVLPDLAPGAGGAFTGTHVIPLRNIDSTDPETAQPESISIFNVGALPVRSDGKERLLLLFDLGQGLNDANGFAILALYDLSAVPKLLDAANVAYDQSTYFRDPGKLSVGDTDVAVTMSMHFNSSQAYVTTALILPRGDRLDLIDAISTFDDTLCETKHTQTVALAATGSGPYSDIAATVTDVTEPTGENCSDEPAAEPSSRKIPVTYRWDDTTSRYAPDSDAFDRLARENEERF